MHGQFSIAKAAAYSSILTLFPAFSDRYVQSLKRPMPRKVCAADIGGGWLGLARRGQIPIALTFFQTRQHHATRIIYSASLVTLLAASGVMIS